MFHIICSHLIRNSPKSSMVSTIISSKALITSIQLFILLNDLDWKIIQEHDQPVKTPLGFAPLPRRDGVEPVP